MPNRRTGGRSFMGKDTQAPPTSTVDDAKPKYTIRAAAQRTGLPPETLRAWEKRYGVPAPARSLSRYRLYSEEDLGEIRWMKVRVDEGIPPRQAAQLARERRAAGRAFQDSPARETGALVLDLKSACLAYDEDRAHKILRHAATVMRPNEIMRKVLLAAVAEINRDWETGLVTPAQEHFASKIARRFGVRIMSLFRERTDANTVVLACAPGEHRELGLLTLAVEARASGMRIVYLGADVPVDALLSAVRDLRPTIVVVAATMTAHLDPWLAAAAAVRPHARKTRFLWAGPGVHQATAKGLPGVEATTIDEALQALTAGHPVIPPTAAR